MSNVTKWSVFQNPVTIRVLLLQFGGMLNLTGKMIVYWAGKVWSNQTKSTR